MLTENTLEYSRCKNKNWYFCHSHQTFNAQAVNPEHAFSTHLQWCKRSDYSSMVGNQNDMLVQADASIMYLGLNCTHCTGPAWSPLRTTTLCPVSAFHTWILPSVEPLKMYCESGLKDASIGMPLLFKWPVKVCKDCPLNASTSLMKDPLVDTRMDFPSLLNLSPVQSHSFSAGSLKVVKGPLSKERRSYNLTTSLFIPGKISKS